RCSTSWCASSKARTTNCPRRTRSCGPRAWAAAGGGGAGRRIRRRSSGARARVGTLRAPRASARGCPGSRCTRRRGRGSAPGRRPPGSVRAASRGNPFHTKTRQGGRFPAKKKAALRAAFRDVPEKLVGQAGVVLGARSALLHFDLLVLLHLVGVELLAALEAGAAVFLGVVVAEDVHVVLLHAVAAAVGALGFLPVLLGGFRRGDLALGAVGFLDDLLGLDAAGGLVLAAVAELAEADVGALELLTLLPDLVGHRFL